MVQRDQPYTLSEILDLELKYLSQVALDEVRHAIQSGYSSYDAMFQMRIKYFPASEVDHFKSNDCAMFVWQAADGSKMLAEYNKKHGVRQIEAVSVGARWMDRFIFP